MSEHVGYVIKVENLRPHSNADKLNILTVFGEDTCVSKDVKVGDIGIYFPCDLQLSEEYCDQNHLCRKQADGTPDTGYLERNTRHVTAIKLRGEKSSGLYMPITSVAYCGDSSFAVGDKVDMVNGHEICRKYIPRSTVRQGQVTDGNRTRKRRAPIAPLFAEHADTEQLAYNMAAFKENDQIEITLKMHGTSQRTGYLPKYAGEKRTIWQKLFGKPGTPIYEYGYVTGTRRTILNDFAEGGFYGNNEFRAGPAGFFEGKLEKGETVYYEVVGFTTSGAPIMASQSNKQVDKLLGDKSFSNKYGDTTVFSYGCESKGELQQDFYVYRMTYTSPEGFVIEYTPDFMRYRCDQMGAKCVPVLWKGFIPDEKGRSDGMFFQTGHKPQYYDTKTPGEWIMEIAEKFYDGADPIGKSHVREGVVIRIVNKPKFCAYKHKNFAFKVLEGLIKENASAPDIEEAEDMKNDEN